MKKKNRLALLYLVVGCALSAIHTKPSLAAPTPSSAKETADLKQELLEIQCMAGESRAFGHGMDKRTLRKQVGPQIIQQMTPQFEKLTEFTAKSPQAEFLGRIDLLYYTARLAYWGQPDQMDALKKMAVSDDPALAARGKICWNFFTWIDANQDHNQKEQLDALDGIKAIAVANPNNDDVARSMVYILHELEISMKTTHSLNLAVAGMSAPFAKSYTKSPDRIGEPIEFSGKPLKGPDFSTTKWKGKVVLVDFWATWCPPCRASVPEVIERYKKYHDQGLEILGVSSDSQRKDLTSFLTENHEMVWPQLFTANSGGYWHPLTTKFEVQGIPTLFLIDRNGLLRERECGHPLPEDSITKLLAETADDSTADAAAAKTVGMK